jgi:penicillin-binding protein 1A
MAKNARRTGGSSWKRRLRIAAAVVIAFVAAYAVGTAVAGPFFWYPCSLNGLEAHGAAHASILYARDGTRLGELGASRDRIPVSFAQISPKMRQAIVAIEDRRFWQHGGVDYLGIVRALSADVSSGTITQGGSTIEQQLVRNLYLTPQQTIGRKLTEGCLAVQLSRQWSKDRILAAYLNDVYFGQQAYGIEAAARAYFGMHARDLNLQESALLAGLPQAPSAYDPLVNPHAALARRNEVLQAMLRNRDITHEQYRQAVQSPLRLHPGRVPLQQSQTYLADFITSQLVAEYGAERVRRGGLRITTTLDAKLETQATRSILGTLDRKGDPAASVVSIDPSNGQIRAMAVAQTGSPISFDIPADGQRQAGSTFKMFVLSEAVRRGINPWTTQYLSAPFTGPGNWHVQTYEHTYSGRIPLTQATLLSDNTVYARLTLDVGPAAVANLAQQMGIQSKLQPVPSVGLGANPVSPLDLASAYATLAAGGVAHRPTILTKVVFPDGHTEQASEPAGKRVLDAKVAAAVTKVLVANVQQGTGTAAALSGRPAAGKTGTTTNYADAWFAGFVPQLTTVVWMGYPTAEKPMTNVHGIAGVTGGTLPAQIWHGYMTAALSGQPVEQFPDPGAPPYKPWCGRYQFARTWQQARKSDSCKTATTTTGKTTTKQQTTTQQQTTSETTIQFTTTSTPPPTTTYVPPTTTYAPPTTTTEPTTTEPTTTEPQTTTTAPSPGG